MSQVSKWANFTKCDLVVSLQSYWVACQIRHFGYKCIEFSSVGPSQIHRYRRKIPDLQNRPSHNVIRNGAPIGIFGSLLTTHAETNSSKLCPWWFLVQHALGLCTMELFTGVYLHAQTAVDAVNIGTWSTVTMRKPRILRIGAPCWLNSVNLC